MTKPQPKEELAAVRRSARRYQKASEERIYWIRRAHEAGASTRTIADAAGLTFGRVAQIVREEVGR